MRFRFCLLLGLLTLNPTRALADTPGSTDITCDVDRTQFRNAARTLPSSSNVTFRLWTDQDPAAPNTQIGSDYTVPLSALNVIKRYTDRYDGVAPRKSERIQAAIGSDGSPVVLPVSGVAFIDLTVGTATLGCDHAATNSPTSRRRLQAVAFARESTHSATCDVCSESPAPADVSVRVYFSPGVMIASGTETAVSWNQELWDTAGFHDNVVNNSKLTVPPGHGGKYLIFCHTEWDAQTGGSRTVRLRSTRWTGGQVAANVSGFTNAYNSVTTVYELSDGDSIECLVSHNLGVDLGLGGDDHTSAFGMLKLN